MHEVIERRRPDSPFFDEYLDDFRMDVVDDALVTGPQQTPHHIGPHPPQPDHAQFHSGFLSLTRP